MSLINDALKRARESQPAINTPANGPALRPVESAPAKNAHRRADYLLPALIVVIVLMAVLFFWQWHHDRVNSAVRARSLPKSIENYSVVKPAKPVASWAALPASKSSAILASQYRTAATTTITIPVSVAATSAPIATVKNVRPAYKLQTIFYQPPNPSAMINGKMVSIGSHISDARVLAISKESATIVTASGKTIILQLPRD